MNIDQIIRFLLPANIDIDLKRLVCVIGKEASVCCSYSSNVQS